MEIASTGGGGVAHVDVVTTGTLQEALRQGFDLGILELRYTIRSALWRPCQRVNL